MFIIYNHATTKLAIYIPMKYLKISCLNSKIGRLLLLSRCMTNYMKTCSFHWNNESGWEFVFKAYAETLIYWIKHVVGTRWNCLLRVGIASMRQFQCVPKTHVTEYKENYLEIHTFPVLCPLYFPPLKSQTVSKYLSLYCKLFMFAWQLYLQMRVHELPLC